MVELTACKNGLNFSFPEVHPEAKLKLFFIRQVRIPDCAEKFRLPDDIGEFRLRPIDDFHNRVPESWLKRGGVIMPMYQAEALWLLFMYRNPVDRQGTYPIAVKVAAGKINAITGEPWRQELSRAPQDYMVSPPQSYLDGYCVEEGVIRQFVAMPLGYGHPSEEQELGEAEYDGGLRILVCPMKREVFERRFPKLNREEWADKRFGKKQRGYCRPEVVTRGSRIIQLICEDPYDISDWDTEHAHRCFVRIVNSKVWRSITGEKPPRMELTAFQYARLNLPWLKTYEKKRDALADGIIMSVLKEVIFGLEKKSREELEVIMRQIRTGKLELCKVREGEF